MADDNSSKRTLVILDLNGLLIERQHVSKYTDKPKYSAKVGHHYVWKRPGLSLFLKMVFRHFDVAVWSSASRRNINTVLNHVFGKYSKHLKFVWSQTECDVIQRSDGDDDVSSGKTSVYNDIFLKNLSRVWENFECYNQTNTIIVDDSKEKMINNPDKCVMISETWSHEKGSKFGFDMGRGIMRKLAEMILFPKDKVI